MCDLCYVTVPFLAVVHTIFAVWSVLPYCAFVHDGRTLSARSFAACRIQLKLWTWSISSEYQVLHKLPKTPGKADKVYSAFKTQMLQPSLKRSFRGFWELFKFLWKILFLEKIEKFCFSVRISLLYHRVFSLRDLHLVNSTYDFRLQSAWEKCSPVLFQTSMQVFCSKLHKWFCFLLNSSIKVSVWQHPKLLCSHSALPFLTAGKPVFNLQQQKLTLPVHLLLSYLLPP